MPFLQKPSEICKLAVSSEFEAWLASSTFKHYQRPAKPTSKSLTDGPSYTKAGKASPERIAQPGAASPELSAAERLDMLMRKGTVQPASQSWTSPSLSSMANSTPPSPSMPIPELLPTTSLSSLSLSSNMGLALFTTDHFETRPSPKGGIGAFAIKDIPKGSLILSELPLLIANPMTLVYEFDRLPAADAAKFMSLYGWHKVDSTLLFQIFKTNRFELDNNNSGIFLKSSRFNHACHPYATCTYMWDKEKGQLITSTLMDIKNGQEITISYGRQASMYENYGFYCDCPGCPDPAQAQREAEMLQKPWTGRWSYDVWE